MELPIDCRNAPFKRKYIDEETPVISQWMIFGEFPDGTVGVSDGTNDIFDWCPREKAEAIVKAREEFVAVVLRELGA